MRYSLGKLCTVVLILALLLLIYIQQSKIVVLKEKVMQLSKELGVLAIDDPEKVYVSAFSTKKSEGLAAR